MTQVESAYPYMWETDVVLADGGTVFVRPIKPSDADRIDALHARLSPETIYFRFFTPLPRLTRIMLDRFVNVDYVDRMAFVALLGDEIIAVARYDRITGSSEAEVAFLVDDAHQGRGLASLMLEHLAAAAKPNGITRFLADTLPDNSKMLRVFHDAGFADRKIFQDGVVRVSFDISPTKESIETMYRRESVAHSNNISKLLNPSVVAVVGASRRSGSVGNRIFHNILAGGFQGTVYPVNPNAHSVAGVRAYPNLPSIPDEVDLAIIVVATEKVEEAVHDAAEASVGGLVIVTAGYSELGPEGAARERSLVRLARRNGMRIVGPNCMGIANTDPLVSLNATLSPFQMIAGRSVLHAQSGPLSLAILEEARRRGLGMATFISSGNKSDISGNDLLNYWEHDAHTDVIMLYIEDFGNPRTFARVARRVSQQKPIIAVKSKRTQQRVPDHMVSTNEDALPTDTAVDALFEQTGVIRVDTLEQLFDQAQAMVNQPLPGGRRVALLANSGGPAPIAADFCRAVGLTVANLSDETIKKLSSVMPANSRLANPVELPNDSRPEHYGEALRLILDDCGIDSCIVLYIPTVATSERWASHNPSTDSNLGSAPHVAEIAATKVAEAVVEAAQNQVPDRSKPVLANFLALHSVPDALRSGRRPVPFFAFPEGAAIALGRMTDYADWRRQPRLGPIQFDNIDPTEAKLVISSALQKLIHEQKQTISDNGLDLTESEHSLWIDEDDVSVIMRCYGIATRPNANQALAHESSRSVSLNLQIIHDQAFGQFMSVGLAGFATEVLGQRVVRSVPSELGDASRLIDAIPGSVVLAGYEGKPPLDRAALEQVISRLSQLSDDLFEVRRVALENLVVTEQGCYIERARIQLSDWSPTAMQLTRSLR